MNLSELLKKITPIRFAQRLGGKKLVDRNGALLSKEQVAVVIVAANVLSELAEAAKPFAHPDLSYLFSSNVQGNASPIFQRNKAILTIGDVKRLQAALANAEEVKEI
jgi:hypothetical protein